MNYNTVDILLVEDNAEDAELTIYQLKKYNMANNLCHVKDGEEAIEYLFASANVKEQNENLNSLKLILLDIKMPKVNGIEVLKKIKSDPRTKTIPIVILTSSKEDPDIKSCYDLGANSYLVKPVNFEGFAEAIKNLGLYWLLLNHPPIR